MVEDGGGGWAKIGVIAGVIGVVLTGVGIWVAHLDAGYPPTPTPFVSSAAPIPAATAFSPPSGLQGAALDLVHNVRGDAGGVNLSSCVSIDAQPDNAAGYGALAIVDCLSSAPAMSYRVRYDRFATPLAVQQYMTMPAKGITPGTDCATGSHSSGWTHGQQVVGSWVCRTYVDTAGTTQHQFFWAASTGLIVGQVSETDADRMLAWWKAHADTVPN